MGFLTSIDLDDFFFGTAEMDAGGLVEKNNGKNQSVFFVNAKVCPPTFSVVKKTTSFFFFPLGLIYMSMYFLVLQIFWSSDKKNDSQQKLGTFDLNELYHHFPSLDFILPISNHPKLNSEIR